MKTPRMMYVRITARNGTQWYRVVPMLLPTDEQMIDHFNQVYIDRGWRFEVAAESEYLADRKV